VILIITVILVVIAFITYSLCVKRPNKIENYIDPIWEDKFKMYYDYYPRSNGSIYGSPGMPWNLFSGYPVYPRAY
jgi:hypothetical protein